MNRRQVLGTKADAERDGGKVPPHWPSAAGRPRPGVRPGLGSSSTSTTTGRRGPGRGPQLGRGRRGRLGPRGVPTAHPHQQAYKFYLSRPDRMDSRAPLPPRLPRVGVPCRPWAGPQVPPWVSSALERGPAPPAVASCGPLACCAQARGGGGAWGPRTPALSAAPAGWSWRLGDPAREWTD